MENAFNVGTQPSCNCMFKFNAELNPWWGYGYFLEPHNKYYRIQMLRSAYILKGYLSSRSSLFSTHDHPVTDQLMGCAMFPLLSMQTACRKNSK